MPRLNSRPLVLAARISALLIAGAAALALTPGGGNGAHNRPLSDFLSAQGTTNQFVPPVPDFIGWTTAAAENPSRAASLDYAGLESRWLLQNGGPDLGTTIVGTLSERPLPDGRVEVTADCHITNALTYAFSFDPTIGYDFATAALSFGYRAQDLAADPTLTPGLSDAHVVWVFNNTAPGAPIPDLVQVLLGNGLPGQEVVSIHLNSTGTGPLHAAGDFTEGQPGSCNIVEIGLALHGNGIPGRWHDGYPAEHIDVRPQ